MASFQAAAVTNSTTLCQNCHRRPVYVENGRVHDFCGRRCMTAFQQGNPTRFAGAASSATATSPSIPAASMPNAISTAATDMTLGTPAQTTAFTGPATTATPTVGASPSGNLCALSGCRRQAYVGSPYCGQAHRKEAVVRGEAEGCLFCTELPKSNFNNKLSDFCSRKCGQDAISHAPIVLAIDARSAAYKDVVNQFTTKWKHSPVPPTIHKVWKIFSDKKITDRFWQYKNNVERNSAIPGANCKRRWHGTARMCKLGDDDQNREFCKSPGCSVCRIIETSFQLTKIGQHTNYGRFGTGIYTSSTSSKAHAYVREHGGSRHKAMLLSDVVMGKTMKLTQSDETLTKPPAGYDSVVGEPGADLNYDEAVVYENDAIRPLFLIIYS